MASEWLSPAAIRSTVVSWLTATGTTLLVEPPPLPS
jgi:hypothetical protein